MQNALFCPRFSGTQFGGGRMAESNTPTVDLRERVRIIIHEADTPAGKAFDVALILAIIASVGVVMFITVPGMDHWAKTLNAFEWGFTILFTVEYALRLWSVDSPAKYARSFFGIIDLLAIVPTYLSLIPGAHLEYLLVVRALRVLRIFRILKLIEYVRGARTIMLALRASFAKITVFLMAVVILATIIGAVMYLVEGQRKIIKDPRQLTQGDAVYVRNHVAEVTSVSNQGDPIPMAHVRFTDQRTETVLLSDGVLMKPRNERFESIPKSIYWAIVTLTTVGYGDITPTSALGQFLAAIVMIMGYSIIAVPTGIVTAEMTRVDGPHAPNTRACPNCGIEGHRTDANHCHACGKTLHAADV
jgi:voltage-gated potassium channel